MNTDSTISTYSYSLKKFMDYLVLIKEIIHNEEYDKLLDYDSEKITDLLEDYVIGLGKNLKSNGINTHLSSVELFFEMNRKVWHKKLVRRSIKKDNIEHSGKTPATTIDIQRMLDSVRHPREKALLHFLSSTGIRPGAIADPILRMKHLTYMPNPNNPNYEQHWCYAVRIYDESNEGYWSFLTPEATVVLDRYFGWRKQIRHEEFNDETPIFVNLTTKSKRQYLDNSGIRRILEKAITNSGIKRIKKGCRYDKAMSYMFRKRFNTILKLNNDVNSNIAEKLMAHKRGLDGTYLQPTREECYREFVKAIPQLTINPTERLKIENEQKQQKIDQLEAKTKTIDEQQKIIEKLQIEQEKQAKFLKMFENYQQIQK